MEAGAWLVAEFPAQNPLELDENFGQPINFRMRVTKFEKLEFTDFGDLDECFRWDISKNIWILNFDVVNLCRKELSPLTISNRLVLVDAGGYEFRLFDHGGLRCSSSIAKSSGMMEFYGGGLPPKVKRAGAFPYELPDDFDHLSLMIRGGTLREV